MKKLTLIGWFVVSLLLGLPVLAHEGDSVVIEDFEEHSNEVALAVVIPWGDELIFQSTLSDRAVSLTVTGPDFVFQKRYESGSPRFLAQEDTGEALPDGRYKYELREIMLLDADMEAAINELSESDLQRQKRQWRREGRWPLPRPKVQFDEFYIKNGYVLAPAGFSVRPE